MDGSRRGDSVAVSAVEENRGYWYGLVTGGELSLGWCDHGGRRESDG